MKYDIESEDFEKLDQLDRIEYRQRYFAALSDYKSRLGFIKTATIGLVFWVFFSSLKILSVGEVKDIFSFVTREIIVIFVAFAIVDLILDIKNSKKFKEYVKELNSKYFDAELKPKRRKR